VQTVVFVVFIFKISDTSFYCHKCVEYCVHSDNLRAALGIKSNQLPPYIYQMRVFGYPPGYLENARQETSGLAMFGKHGLGVLLK